MTWCRTFDLWDVAERFRIDAGCGSVRIIPANRQEIDHSVYLNAIKAREGLFRLLSFFGVFVLLFTGSRCH